MKIRDYIIVVQLNCHMQGSRRWLLIYPWKYSGTTSVFKIRTATCSLQKKNLTKIKLLQCSDRPIFQLPEQRKCVSAVATQRQHKPAHVHVFQRVLKVKRTEDWW